ncbi:MAG: hypothetical protein GX575_15665 [Candidatus Anammoximicrobium sp.]|nr:hypothetical protein [Candidatus Anammoximicrobium sp.]
MAIERIGPSLYSEGGTVFEPQVATIFTDTQTLVTEGTTHLRHREVYCDRLEERRRAAQAEPLTASERSKIWRSGVDLIIQPDLVLIRPDPDQIDRVLEADELLQEIVNKQRIRFQLASNAKVFAALTKRGELWRIASDAVTTEEMKERIRNARMKLEGRAIYYYSPATGTRFLTLNEMRMLAGLNAAELHQHLTEIQTYCQRYSKRGGLEVDFFKGRASLRTAFRDARLPADDEEALRAEYQRLCRLFEEHVPPHLRSDDVVVEEWRLAMHDALYPLEEHSTETHEWLGLAAPFRKHVKWLPGGRLKRGHLDFDPVFDKLTEVQLKAFENQQNRRARAIILNFVRDYGDLEYINVGWINESLSRAHRPERGHRDVYVVAIKRASEDREHVHMLRMQKWDMTFRLDHGKSAETAMFETEEYTEYTQDRYLGCRRLGMNLFGPVRIGKISELYRGTQTKLAGTPIWTPYFEREYVPGIATDRLTEEHWNRPGYAERLAQLLGQAAASSLIVGRGDGRTEGSPDQDLIVFFDDGDEVVVERDKMIESLVVMHHTGSFWHFQPPLCRFAAAYARPVLRRWDKLPDPAAFARIYLDAMIGRFTDIQREYREDRHAFEHLFHLRHVRPEGNFAHRWQCVLRRLDETDPAALKDAVAAWLKRTAT